MEPNHKYSCHLEATPPQDAPLQCEASMWVDVWAPDFDIARNRLNKWLTQMGCQPAYWQVVSIERSSEGNN